MSYLRFDRLLGDHGPVMANLAMGSVLGKHLKNIVPVQVCRLNSKVTQAREAYIKQLEALYQEHGVWDKLEGLAKSAEFKVILEAAWALENLDQLTEKIVLVAEKRCCKLNTDHYEFSPQVKEELGRCHIFRALLQLKTGKKVRDKGNVKIFARQCGIIDQLNAELRKQTGHHV